MAWRDNGGVSVTSEVQAVPGALSVLYLKELIHLEGLLS